MKSRNGDGIRVAAMTLVIMSVGLFSAKGRTQEAKAIPKDHIAMMQSCAKVCSECQLTCDACATHCAQMLNQSKKEHLATLTTCRDCATVCSAAAQIVARSGPSSNVICTACAETCSSCAKECEKFVDDAKMKACAEECRKCMKACTEMVKHAESSK